MFYCMYIMSHFIIDLVVILNCQVFLKWNNPIGLKKMHVNFTDGELFAFMFIRATNFV